MPDALSCVFRAAKRQAVVVLFVAAALKVGAEDLSAAPAQDLLELNRPVVIAHRGYSKFAPENTLPSFQLAKLAGSDLVELDYHHTRDGTPVVIHDSELDRTTDAIALWGGSKIRVDSRTMDELRALDAGRWFKPAPVGTPLPTLVQALESIQDGGVALIERKSGDAATCVALLRERDLVNRVVVQSFDWDYLMDFHRQEPRQVLGALGPPGSYGGKALVDSEKALDKDWVDAIEKTGARVVVWNRQITREAVTYAHQRGIKVWVYTIDEAPLANELLDLGADGLISNNVSVIWRTLALRSASQASPPSHMAGQRSS